MSNSQTVAEVQLETPTSSCHRWNWICLASSRVSRLRLSTSSEIRYVWIPTSQLCRSKVKVEWRQSWKLSEGKWQVCMPWQGVLGTMPSMGLYPFLPMWGPPRGRLSPTSGCFRSRSVERLVLRRRRVAHYVSRPKANPSGHPHVAVLLCVCRFPAEVDRQRVASVPEVGWSSLVTESRFPLSPTSDFRRSLTTTQSLE